MMLIYTQERYDVPVQTLALSAVIISAISFVIIMIFLMGRILGRKRGSSDIEAGKQIERLERISKGIETLSSALTIPHVRGGIGETLLAELLQNWLPKEGYRLQYRFRDNTRVDAVVVLGTYLVSVDAKFPLESFRSAMQDDDEVPTVTPDIRRALMRHIADISDKYIKPDEGTLQFALMYVPSESVYYRAFVQEDSGSGGGSLLEIALERGVVPASPSTLFLYLQTVSYGLRGFAFPEKFRELAKTVGQFRVDIDALGKSFTLAGTHLKNFQKAFEDANTRFNRLDLSLQRLEE